MAEVEIVGAGDARRNAGRGAVLPLAAEHHRDAGEVQALLLADVDFVR